MLMVNDGMAAARFVGRLLHSTSPPPSHCNLCHLVCKCLPLLVVCCCAGHALAVCHPEVNPRCCRSLNMCTQQLAPCIRRPRARCLPPRSRPRCCRPSPRCASCSTTPSSSGMRSTGAVSCPFALFSCSVVSLAASLRKLLNQALIWDALNRCMRHPLGMHGLSGNCTR